MKARVFFLGVGHEAIEFLRVVKYMPEYGAAEMGVAAALRLGRFLDHHDALGAMFPGRQRRRKRRIAAAHHNYVKIAHLKPPLVTV